MVEEEGRGFRYETFPPRVVAHFGSSCMSAVRSLGRAVRWLMGCCGCARRREPLPVTPRRREPGAKTQAQQQDLREEFQIELERFLLGCVVPENKSSFRRR